MASKKIFYFLFVSTCTWYFRMRSDTEECEYQERMKLMIPKNITRNDVLNAIKKIGNEGFPHRRKSIKYDIWCEYPYPPKYVISIANLIANGQKLKPSRFSGGAESNSFLINLGFVIVRKS